MRKPGWKRSPPADDGEAREKLVQAAVACIERDGFDRTTVASVAREAGVTRATLYRYFKDGQDLLRGAAIRVGGGILDRMERHVGKFDSAEERIVEAMVFLWREIPDDPLLSHLFLLKGDRAAVHELVSETTTEYAARILATLYERETRQAVFDRRMVERAEILIRLLWTFLLAPGRLATSDHKLRAALRRWVVPMIV
jgi:AcrR family transcriptional regulator